MGILALLYFRTQDEAKKEERQVSPSPPGSTPGVSSAPTPSPGNTQRTINPNTATASATVSPLPLNPRSVLLAPPGFLSTSLDRTFTRDFRDYAYAAVRTAILKTERLEIAERELADAIAGELLYNDELRRHHGHPSISAAAYDIAARHGARWIFLPEVNIEQTVHKRDLSGALPISVVTVRVEVYICDVMSQVTNSSPFSAKAEGPDDIVSDPSAGLRRELVRSLIESASSAAFAGAEFKRWIKTTQNQ
jgi:hypothetical protein